MQGKANTSTSQTVDLEDLLDRLTSTEVRLVALELEFAQLVQAIGDFALVAARDHDRMTLSVIEGGECA